VGGGRILKNKIVYFKLLVLVATLVLPWSVNNRNTSEDILKLNESTLTAYESLICDYSITEFISNNNSSDYQIKFDTTSSIGCFSKINGTSQIDSEIVIYVGTNINLDLLIQSFFWLVLLSMIPISEKYNIKYKNTSILLLLLLLGLHLTSEQYFYNLNSKIFSTNLANNYLLYSYLLGVYLVLLTFVNILENRFYNFTNYLPYIFLVVGTYNTSNLNFFLLCFSFLGISQTLVNKRYKLMLLVVLVFTTFWTSQVSQSQLFFDVDKLKGFSSSSYNIYSIFFWSLMYFFLCCGLVFLFKNTIKYIQVNKLLNNFLYSGVLLTVLSLFSATGPIQNLYTYYYLGLNKRASSTFESVSGNAWRGISPSAEGVGEFYAFIILLVVTVTLKNKPARLSYLQLSLIVVNLYGLYRSNNFAASFSMVLLIIAVFVFHYFKSTKLKYGIVFGILISIPISYVIFFNTASLDELNRKVIKEGLEISYIENLENNEYGLTAVEQNRFLELLQNQEDLKKVSTSLSYLIEKYHFSERNNLPNVTSLISSVAYPINRSEKWGIFIGKYNPSMKTFILGTGINNLVDYYLHHPTKVNSGLVLPHSGFLSYLVYIGALGIFILILLLIIKIIRNKNHPLFIVYVLFMFVNILKSDSVLYINNFILLLFVLHLDKLNFSGFKNTSSDINSS
jgi:hypothetical protein